ncbi:MAG TPA: biopolymer transporter ExbD [Candidatus Glassbacteria bacterium]|nr:biopolymer transporter ExbD [Candidatus Glassbacteria bacterium]
MQFSRRTRRKAAISLISLVDVVFLLLIFFTVSATFMDQPGINVNLPEYGKDGDKKSRTKSEPTTITVSPTREIYFGDKMVKLTEIKDLMQEKMLEGQTKQVIIKADTLSQYGIVFEVLRQLKESNIDSISFSYTSEKILKQ